MMLFISGEKNSGFRCMMMILILMLILSLFSCTAIDDNYGYSSHLRRKRSDMELHEGNSCRTRANELGICKRIMSCEEYVQGLRSKTIKYSFMFRCGFIGFSEVVCCPIRNIRTDPWTESPIQRTVPTTRTRNTPPSTIPTTNNWYPVLKSIPVIDYRDISPKPAPTINNGISVHTHITKLVTPREPPIVHQNERPSQAACREWKSLNPASLTYHILGGESVSVGEYPHMGAMIRPSEDGGNDGFEVLCGSSLIARRYALTAAHCISDKDWRPKIVRFGVVVVNSEEYDDYEIEEYITHPDYRPKFKYHDIGFVKLNQSVVFTIYTRPACLFTNIADVDQTKDLVVIGWGVIDMGTRARSEKLLYGNLSTVPLDTCRNTYTHQGVGRSLSRGIEEGQYCARDEQSKSDACQADSGGPLQLVENKESTIVGVVSFGLSCGSRAPSVFARVAFYLNWIESVVWPS